MKALAIGMSVAAVSALGANVVVFLAASSVVHEREVATYYEVTPSFATAYPPGWFILRPDDLGLIGLEPYTGPWAEVFCLDGFDRTFCWDSTDPPRWVEIHVQGGGGGGGGGF